MIDPATDPRAPRWQQMRDERNRRVIEAACVIAVVGGLRNVTRKAVAEVAEVSLGSVNLAVGDVTGLHNAVVREAISRPLLSVLAEALVMGHPFARDAPDELKAAALNTVS